MDGGLVNRRLAQGFDGDPARHPLALGRQPAVPGVAIDVLERNAQGAPTRVRFRFDRALGASTVLAWQGRSPAAWTPPAPGRTAVLARVSAM